MGESIQKRLEELEAAADSAPCPTCGRGGKASREDVYRLTNEELWAIVRRGEEDRKRREAGGGGEAR